MPFSKRHMVRHTLQIIRATGQVIGCYLRGNIPIPPRVPTDIYDNSPSPDSSNTTLSYIFATYEQDVAENPVDSAGLVGTITGTLIIPCLYKSIVNNTEFFDPYLNGSKFIKVGAVLDDQGIALVQNIKALYLPEIGWLQ